MTERGERRGSISEGMGPVVEPRDDLFCNRIAHDKVITLPHLGASTHEAQDNCAVMVVKQVMDFLQHGNIQNAVNFPEMVMPRNEGIRITIANENIPNMVGQISTVLGDASINILDLLNRSKGDIAYTLIDVDQDLPAKTRDALKGIEGVLALRVLVT